MINCMLDEGHGAVYVKGSLRDIMADVTILIKRIHDELDEDSAHVFKSFAKDLLVDLAFANDEELSEMNKRYKKVEKESEENFNNALKKLKNLLNGMDLEDDKE